MKQPVAKPAAAAPPKIDYAAYTYAGAFDRAKIRAGYLANFSQVEFTASTLTDLEQLLGFMESDAAITDLRWVAYILATVMWETKTAEAVRRVVKDKKGQPLLDKAKQPVTRAGTAWHAMAPISEHGFGKGRLYYQPVKVDVSSADKTVITEHDGDQFEVSSAGTIKPVTKKARMGAVATGAEAVKYRDAKGAEHAYYGRGYVQLTWWSNYLAAGVALGVGTELLVNPDKVNQAETAYKIMAQGMRTGRIFANGHKLTDYFKSGSTDYAGARAMVNARDPEPTIVRYAKKFEAILLDSKLGKQ